MKKALFVAAVVSALVACSLPVTSYAADMTLVKRCNGYVILHGQGLGCLQQTIKDIYEYLAGNNIFCPETPETPVQPADPDVQEPDTSTQPDDQKPGSSIQPDDQKPGASTQPDDQKPGSSAQPGDQKPGASTQPDDQKPGASTQPDDQKPGASTQPGATAPEGNLHPYAVQIWNLVNTERVNAGLPELELDINVTAAANVRAKEIKQNFSHSRPNGGNFSSALKEQGVSYTRSGENIAWGQKSPEQVMNGWMNSEGHRANILNRNFKKMGIGYYQDENGVNYWVQLFIG